MEHHHHRTVLKQILQFLPSLGQWDGVSLERYKAKMEQK